VAEDVRVGAARVLQGVAEDGQGPVGPSTASRASCSWRGEAVADDAKTNSRPEDAPPVGPDGLTASLLDDQRRRWEAGERVSVEFYLQAHPLLRGQPEAVLDLVYNEVFLRGQAGERPRPEEYLGRYPHLAEQLRRQFEVDRALEEGSLAGPTLPAGRDDPFTSVRLSAPSGSQGFLIANVREAAVPEPATPGLFLVGMAGAVGYLWRRRAGGRGARG
jgi:hypothetical protein